MSLINEALKKAQRQRSLDSAPLSAAPSGVAAAAVTTHVRAASHKRSYAPLWFGLGILGLGVGSTVLVMRYGIAEKPAQPAPAPTAAVAPVAPPKPAGAGDAVAASPAPAPVAAPAPAAPMVVLPSIAPASPSVAAPAKPEVVAKAEAPTPQSLASSPTPAPAVPAAPVVANIAPAPVAAPKLAAATSSVVRVDAAANREAQIYAFLGGLRLTGVRGTGREARVLMNERVWRLNDIVSPELELRLSAVRPGLLVFTDAQGKTYEKSH